MFLVKSRMGKFQCLTATYTMGDEKRRRKILHRKFSNEEGYSKLVCSFCLICRSFHFGHLVDDETSNFSHEPISTPSHAS